MGENEVGGVEVRHGDRQTPTTGESESRTALTLDRQDALDGGVGVVDSAVAPAFSKLAVAATTLLIVACHFVLIGMYPLVEPDEPRYAEIAREMIALGDWVTPHLNYVKYFEKPPLIYWLTAISMQSLGSSELVVRLWPVLFSLLGIATVAGLGRAMFGRGTGFVAASILAATPLYFALGQVLILDMPLCTLMTVAFAAFWMAYTAPQHRQAWTLLFYVALALAVLTKGPVAVVLSGAIIVTFLLLRLDFASLRWILSPAGIGVFLLIALPWFVLVSVRNPGFVDFFVIKQHFDRFARPDEHRESIFFFVPIVLGGMLPWTFLFVAAPGRVRAALSRLLRWPLNPATLYCLLWAGVIFVFFSVSGSKLATYILPVLPPLALLGGRLVTVVIRQGDVRVLRRTGICLQVIAAAVLVGAVVVPFVADRRRALILTLCLAGGALVFGSVARLMRGQLERTDSTPQRRVAAAFGVLVAGMLIALTVALNGRNVGQHYEELAYVVRAQARPDDLVVMYRHYTQGIPYYARRRIVMVGAWGELDFGRQQGDNRAFFWPDDRQLVEAWGSGRRLYLVINRSELEALRAQLQPPPRQIAAQDKKVLVVNFAGDDGSTAN